MVSMRGAWFTAVEVLLVGSSLFLLVAIAAAAGGKERNTRAGFLSSSLFGLWFLLIWELARLGVFEGGRRDARQSQTLAVILPLVAAFLAAGVARSAGLQSLIAGRNLGAVHLYRVSSIAALGAWISEALPLWIAVPIGLGDPAVALLGVLFGRRQSGPGVWWHAAGISVATFSILATTSAGARSAFFLTVYPLVLIPMFLAPVAILLHAWGLALSREARDAASAPRGS